MQKANLSTGQRDFCKNLQSCAYCSSTMEPSKSRGGTEEERQHLLGPDGGSSAKTSAPAMANSSGDASVSTACVVQPVNIQRMVTVEPTMLLYALYIFGHRFLQQLLLHERIAMEFQHSDSEPHWHNGSNDTCSSMTLNGTNPSTEAEIQAKTSLFLGFTMVCLLVPSFFSTVLIGGYSDKGGRKIGLYCPQFGAIVSLTVTILVITCHLNYYLLLLSSFMDGLFGGFATFLMASFSYISDVTTEQQRSLHILVAELALTVGILAASLGIGFLVEILKFFVPCALLIVICLLNTVYTLFLPETLHAPQGIKFWTFSHFHNTISVCAKNDCNGRRWKIMFVYFVVFGIAAASLATGDITTLYLLAFPFCWGPVLIGVFAATKILVGIIVSLSLTKLLQQRCGDLGLIVLGCLSMASAQILLAFAYTTTLVFTTTIVGSASLVVIAMGRSYASKVVAPGEIGAVFAGLELIQLAGILIGTMVANPIYSSTVDWFPGFCFVVMASVIIVVIIMTIITLVHTWRQNRGASMSGYSIIVESANVGAPTEN